MKQDYYLHNDGRSFWGANLMHNDAKGIRVSRTLHHLRRRVKRNFYMRKLGQQVPLVQPMIDISVGKGLVVCHDSHIDHVPVSIITYLLGRYSDRETGFIETIELKGQEFDSTLHGPIMGDDPVTDVHHAIREGRSYESRLCHRPVRKTDKLTVIAGEHLGIDCVLFTCFGGPLTPREVNDPALADDQRAESVAFWATHALRAAQAS